MRNKKARERIKNVPGLGIVYSVITDCLLPVEITLDTSTGCHCNAICFFDYFLIRLLPWDAGSFFSRALQRTQFRFFLDQMLIQLQSGPRSIGLGNHGAQDILPLSNLTGGG